MSTQLEPELERRIRAMESGVDQGSGFTGGDTLWLIALGVVGPVALLVWGWMS